MQWQVQEAKQRFSEFLRSAQQQGPQVVTRHGEEVAVLLDIEEFHRLKRKDARKMDFREFLLSGPRVDDDDLDFDSYRSGTRMRDVDFD